MNGGMTECGRCDCDPCVCDKQRIEISDIIHKLDNNYTLEYKMYLIYKGMFLTLVRISDKVSKGRIRFGDIEILEKFITIRKEIFHTDKWWQFWK